MKFHGKPVYLVGCGIPITHITGWEEAALYKDLHKARSLMLEHSILPPYKAKPLTQLIQKGTPSLFEDEDGWR